MQNEEQSVDRPTKSKPEEKPSESKPEEKPSENKPEDKPSTNEPLTASDQSSGDGEKEKENDVSSVKQEEDTKKEEERPKLNVEKVWKYIHGSIINIPYSERREKRIIEWITNQIPFFFYDINSSVYWKLIKD